MTCILAYKDQTNYVCMASDRGLVIKKNILMAAEGSPHLYELVLKQDEAQFPTPYVKNNSYDEYFEKDFIPSVMKFMRELRKPLDKYEDHATSFIISIDHNFYTMSITCNKKLQFYCYALKCPDASVLYEGYEGEKAVVTFNKLRDEGTSMSTEDLVRGSCLDQLTFDEGNNLNVFTL